MQLEKSLTRKTRWAVALTLAVVHPVLLYKLYPYLGTPINSLNLVTPVAATLLLGWRVGICFILLNSVSIGIVLSRISDIKLPEDLPRGVLPLLVTSAFCVGADRLRHFLAQRRAIEEELLNAKKMEAIGRLAGGVAHDMNNTLNAIMGSAFALRQELTPYGRRFKDLDHIAAACDRGAQLTRNLLGFARKSSYKKQTFSLNAVVESVQSLLKRTTSRNIRIETDLTKGLPLMEGDQGQIENAVMNLCLNALDAMSDQGTLSMTTRLDDNEVSIIVKDTGTGMDENIREHVFEPFFTTKPAGKGTGLGLSMVYGVVHAMNGGIVLDSVPGVGTTITLTFARIDAPPTEMSRSSIPPPAEDTLEGNTILIIDDEPLVLRSGVRMLRSLGCDVLSAGSGPEGMELLRAHQGTVSLAIIDLIMPEMDGTATLDELLKIDPELPALLVSGYTRESDPVENLQNHRATVGFLAKPYHSSQLIAAAKQLLSPDRISSVPPDHSRSFNAS